MKFRPLEDFADPATIRGERDRTMKRAHAAPAHRTGRVRRRLGVSSRDSNIHNRLNGIADAEANPIRPSSMFGSESLVDRYKEIEPIQPIIVSIDRAKRRLTSALGSRATTTRARHNKTEQSVRMPNRRRSVGIYVWLLSLPITRAETLPPKLWPFSKTCRTLAVLA